MAKTLVQIKDQLLELSRRKTEISGYDHQMDVLESFAVRIDTLKKITMEMKKKLRMN